MKNIIFYLFVLLRLSAIFTPLKISAHPHTTIVHYFYLEQSNSTPSYFRMRFNHVQPYYLPSTESFFEGVPESIPDKKHLLIHSVSTEPNHNSGINPTGLILSPASTGLNSYFCNPFIQETKVWPGELMRQYHVLSFTEAINPKCSWIKWSTGKIIRFIPSDHDAEYYRNGLLLLESIPHPKNPPIVTGIGSSGKGFYEGSAFFSQKPRFNFWPGMSHSNLFELSLQFFWIYDIVNTNQSGKKHNIEVESRPIVEVLMIDAQGNEYKEYFTLEQMDSCFGGSYVAEELLRRLIHHRIHVSVGKIVDLISMCRNDFDQRADGLARTIPSGGNSGKGSDNSQQQTRETGEHNTGTEDSPRGRVAGTGSVKEDDLEQPGAGQPPPSRQHALTEPDSDQDLINTLVEVSELGNSELVEEILKTNGNGLLLRLHSENRYTALYAAIKFNRTKVIEIIQQCVDNDEKIRERMWQIPDKDGVTPYALLCAGSETGVASPDDLKDLSPDNFSICSNHCPVWTDEPNMKSGNCFDTVPKTEKNRGRKTAPSLAAHPWLTILRTYLSQGLLIRGMSFNHVNMGTRIKNLFQLGLRAPASLLLPGISSSTFSPENSVGFLFVPDFNFLARFKTNSRTYMENRKAVKDSDYNHLPRPNGNYYKNHLNNFSLMLKLRELSLRKDGSLCDSTAYTSHTSGHIDEQGQVKSGKPLTKTLMIRGDSDAFTLSHNEVIVQWQGAADKLMGLSLCAPINTSNLVSLQIVIDHLRRTFNEEKLLQLPVVGYIAKSAEFRYLGSVKSFIKSVQCTIPSELTYLIEKINARDSLFDMIADHYDAFDRIWAQAHPEPTFFPWLYTYIRGLFTGDNSGENRQVVLKEYLEEHQSLVIHNTFTAESFSENLSQLVYFVSRAGQSDKSRQIYLSVLKAVAYRQLLENQGNTFSDEESFYLPLSVVIVQHPDLENVIPAYQKILTKAGVSASLVTDLINALYVGADECQGQCALFHKIITSAVLSPNSHKPDAFKNIDRSIDRAERVMLKFRLNKGHVWLYMLDDLQMCFRRQLVLALQREGIKTQPWPYAELSIDVPSQMTILDFLFSFSEPGKASSPLSSELLQHYIKNGIPEYPGTLQAGHVTYKTKQTLKTIMSKRISHDNLIRLKSDFSIIQREWEMPIPLVEYSPFDGMEAIADQQ